MRFMLLILACFVTACGGGATGTTLQTAALSGNVLELEGQTLDRSGVQVTVLETGASAVTDVNGRFELPRVPVGTVTLQFGGDVARLTQNGADDIGFDDNGVDPDDDDELEDNDGNPRIRGIEANDAIEVRCSINDGQVREFRASGNTRPRSEIKLERDGLEAEVEIESGDRQKIEFEIEGLAPGTVIDFLLDGNKLASIAADATGQAELEFEGALPNGAANVSELEGLIAAFVLAETGETLFELEVPAVMIGGGGGNGGDDDARGKARLTPFAANVEGYVEIRSRPGDQRFKVEAEHLGADRNVIFQIEDPENPGTFVDLATRSADAMDEAEISTQDGLAMPLSVSDVSELVGLEVRVRDEATGDLLLSGVVPPLADN